MACCEMCGKEDFLVSANVEGTVLKVCKTCSKFGEVISIPRPPAKKNTFTKRLPESKQEERVVEDYASMIKAAREKMGLKQEDLANRVAEKVSLIHHLEANEFKPSIHLARKMQRFLHVRLIEQDEEHESAISITGKAGEMTLGDLVRIRKR